MIRLEMLFNAQAIGMAMLEDQKIIQCKSCFLVLLYLFHRELKIGYKCRGKKRIPYSVLHQ